MKKGSDEGKQAVVEIELNVHTAANEEMFLSGTLPQLGDWDVSKALKMVPVKPHSREGDSLGGGVCKWRLKEGLKVNLHCRFEFKFFKKFGQYMEWESLPANRKFKVKEGGHLQLVMDWNSPKGTQFRCDRQAQQKDMRDSLDNFAETLRRQKTRDYLKLEMFDSDSELSSSGEQDSGKVESGKPRHSYRQKFQPETKTNLLRLYNKLEEQANLDKRTRKYSLTVEEKLEVAILLDHEPDYTDPRVKRIIRSLEGQSLTFWVKGTGDNHDRVRFYGACDSHLRLADQLVYLYAQGITSETLFERMQRHRVGFICCIDEEGKEGGLSSSFEAQLQSRKLDLVLEDLASPTRKPGPEKGEVLIYQVDYLDQRTIRVFRSPAEPRPVHPSHLKPSKVVNQYLSTNRNRIFILDLDIFSKGGLTSNSANHGGGALSALAKEKYNTLFILTRATREQLQDRGLLALIPEQSALLSMNSNQFRLGNEWVSVPQLNFRLLLRAMVQHRSIQKGLIDFMMVVLDHSKEWLFQECLQFRFFNKHYFKQVWPQLIVVAPPGMSRGHSQIMSADQLFLRKWSSEQEERSTSSSVTEQDKEQIQQQPQQPPQPEGITRSHERRPSPLVIEEQKVKEGRLTSLARSMLEGEQLLFALLERLKLKSQSF